MLETHVLRWWFANRQLSPRAPTAIGDPANEVMVSAATAWEISIKKSLGKLRAPDDLAFQLEQSGFRGLPISIEHALTTGALPRHHDDFFDHLLVAQALLEGLTVVTRDSRFAAYAIELLAA